MSKREGWSHREDQRIGEGQSQLPRTDWQAFVPNVPAGQFVLLDESLSSFKFDGVYGLGPNR